MGSLIKNRDLFLFFVMGSSLDSGLDVLCEGIGYPYAGTWKDGMSDGMGRNALCEGTWKDGMSDDMGRNALYEGTWKDGMSDGMGRNALCEGTWFDIL